MGSSKNRKSRLTNISNSATSFMSRLLGPAIDFILDPIKSFFSRYFRLISRSLAFAKFGWSNYDYDSAYLYKIMSFKMARIHKDLVNGHAVQQQVNLRALKQAIAICDRLYKDEYEEKYLILHDKKWGKIVGKSSPIYDDNGVITSYSYSSERKKAKTKKQKDKEMKEFKLCLIKADNDRLSDLDLLNEIFKNHLRHWWD